MADLIPGSGVSLKNSKVSSFGVHCDADGSVDERELLQADSLIHGAGIRRPRNLHTDLWKNQQFSKT